MNTMIRFGLVGALVLGMGWNGAAQQRDGVPKLMAQKLDNSKTILEGIALADFTKITRSAEKLIQLSRTEEWLVYKTPRYEIHSNEFRRAAETLISKSQAKNLDGVTLAYFDLTMSCVRCHQYVREVRDARLPPRPNPPAASGGE